MSKIFIGIDTGINGACIALDEFGSIVSSFALPHKKIVPCYRKKGGKAVSRLDLGTLFDWLQDFCGIATLVVEESPSYGMGVTSAYTSGYNSGSLKALCESVTPTQTVAPKTWQKPLKEGKERWTKERSLALAVEFYGDKEIFVKPKRTADGFADACHIASWGMKQT